MTSPASRKGPRVPKVVKISIVPRATLRRRMERAARKWFGAASSGVTQRITFARIELMDAAYLYGERLVYGRKVSRPRRARGAK